MTAASTFRRIAIAVDDVGLHSGICEAVLKLALIGRVQAAGCMVGGDRWPADAIRLRQLPRTQVELGLHLDLTEVPQRMKPVRQLPLLWCAAYVRALPKAVLADEIDAQLDAFESAIGRPPDFVDGHQHVHQLPVIREVLLERLIRRGTGYHPWLRATRRPSQAPSGHFLSRSERLKPWLIEALGAAALASRARAAGFTQNRALIGSYDFRGSEARYAGLLAGWLTLAGDGDVLMSHPSKANHAGDTHGPTRQFEYRVLASEKFGRLLKDAAIELTPVGAMHPLKNTAHDRAATICAGNLEKTE